MDKKIYDTVLIGNSPQVYMCGIYLKTSNLNICILKSDPIPFSGFNEVPGVFDVESCEGFLNLLIEQSSFLNIAVLDNKVCEVSHERYFKIDSKEETFYSKTLVVDRKDFEVDSEGCFNATRNSMYDEAIVLSAQGCKTSFDVREYINSLE